VRATPGTCAASPARVSDFVFLLVTAAFFAISIAYARALDRT
jgi:hypothetical protein